VPARSAGCHRSERVTPAPGSTRAEAGRAVSGAARRDPLLFKTAQRHNWAMDPQPGSTDGQTSRPFPAPGVDAQIASQIMLAEYSALRTEMDRRAAIQWNVLALQVTSAGVIASLAISHASEIALLLVIPLSSYMLGSRYILHDFHLKLISRYIRDSLSGRLQGHLAWDSWKMSQMASGVGPRGWLTPTAWNLLHPTRLAFEGVAWLALLTAALAATYSWRDRAPAWGPDTRVRAAMGPWRAEYLRPA
jgi:hypothetical protein